MAKAKRKPMLTYRNVMTRRDEHIAIDRVVGFGHSPLSGDTMIKIDYGDGVERVAYSSDTVKALEDRLRRIQEANGG